MRKPTAESILSWSLPLFRGFGVPVRLHWSFLLALFFFVTREMEYAQSFGHTRGTALAWGLAHVAGLFGLVLAHEFGHALAARSQGVAVQEILLTPLGGLARAAEPMPGPRTDLLVTAAGPAVNLFLIVPTFVLMLVLKKDPGEPQFFGAQVLPFLFFTNMILAAFNLLPAFPMDGGRMVAAAMSLRMDHRKAFWLAARLGYLMGAAMILGGLYLSASFGGWILFFIGISNIIACYSLQKQLQAGAVVYVPSGRVNVDSGGLDGARWGGPFGLGSGGAGEPDEESFLVGPSEYKEHSLRREQERAMRRRVDELLDKVRRGGTESLTREEKDFLRSASRKFRQWN